MDLDWITLYDYMTIHSQSSLKQKINKFYESFYPLKLKKTTRKKLQFHQIERGGLLGIIATYISRVLSVLNLYLQAEYLLAKNKTKQLIKLSRMFIEIQSQNLEASLRLEKTVFIIQEAYLFYIGKEQEIKKNQMNHKGFLQMKLLGSLKRIFQFYYNLEDIKHIVDHEGYSKIYSILMLNSVQTFQKAQPHFKLFPEISEILGQILRFFSSDQKEPFNFHAHLIDQNKKGVKKTFKKIVKQILSLIPNKQKQLFINLSDENFFDFLIKSGVQLPKQFVQNYFRSEEQINALIAQQENFLESILVAEKHRGKPEWKKSVMEQLVNLSSENKKSQKSNIIQSKKFRFSEDFPLFNN